jgi:hypothetical protein
MTNSTTSKSVYSINWGTGIFIFMTFFISTGLFMVYRASQHSFPLIKKDYYQDDIHLAALLEKKDRAISNGYNHVVNGQELSLTLTKSFQPCSGTIEILSPFDASLDKKIDFNAKDGKAIISLAGLKPGKWIVKTTYTINGEISYAEHAIVI